MHKLEVMKQSNAEHAAAQLRRAREDHALAEQRADLAQQRRAILGDEHCSQHILPPALSTSSPRS